MQTSSITSSHNRLSARVLIWTWSGWTRPLRKRRSSQSPVGSSPDLDPLPAPLLIQPSDPVTIACRLES